MDILPSRVMADILWAFHGRPFTSKETFNKAVHDYHLRIVKSAARWRPEALAIARANVRVQYLCWREDEQIEPVVLLKSDDGASFSQGELLYQIHNAVIEDLREQDHSFFEGLSLYKQPSKGEAPLYFLSLGS